jgi:formyl-CoA transferase
VPRALGNHHPSICPYGLFKASDGPVQIAVGNDAQWAALRTLLAIDDTHGELERNAQRVARRADVVAMVNAALSMETSDAWVEKLTALGIPVGKVRTVDQVYEWDQTRSQGLVVKVDHETLGTIELPGPTLRFDDQGFAGDRETHLPPPTLGQHKDSVARWLDSVEPRAVGEY